MYLVPMSDYLLIERVKMPDEIRGIIVPETAKEKAQHGYILQKGPKVSESLEIGQRVAFGRWSGTDVPLIMPDGMQEVRLVLHEGEILCTVEEHPDEGTPVDLTGGLGVPG